MSRYPLSALQSVGLGGGGSCLRADLDLAGKRVHLFNIQLVIDPVKRGQQINRLMREDLLGASLPCATLIAGDFSIPLLGSGQWAISRQFKRVQHPRWGANYPAFLPLWARDRIYSNGPIRSLAGQVVRRQDLHKLSNHLPIVTTFELTDTYIYLKSSDASEHRMRPAVGEA